MKARENRGLAALALVVVTLLAYSNSFRAGFALDNRGLLLQDARIRQATSENIGLILQHTYWWPYGESGLYRPFTTLSYMLNYAVLGNGEEAAGYHWINLLLHAGNVLLVFALARRLLAGYEGGFWAPVLVAAVWAVHPVLTESVTNIVGRADLLAGAALLGGFLMYLKSTETAGWRRAAWLAALMAVTSVGVFSKEGAVVIPGVILLYELTWWKQRRQAKGLLLGCLAVLPPIQWMLYQRAAVLFGSSPTEFPFTDNPIVAAGFWTGRLTALRVIARYLGLMAWPATLSCDYSYSQIPLADGSLQDWAAWLVVAAVAASVVLLWRWNRAAFFVSGFAILTFLPTSNLLFPIGTIMAERFLYLPCMLLAFCLVQAVYAAGRRVGVPVAAPALLCVIIAAFAIRTWARNADWRDDFTLGAAAVKASPKSFKPHKMLAYALSEGDPNYSNGHANIDRVLEEAEKSMSPLNALPDSLNNADTYLRAGNYYFLKGGSEAYRRSLQLLQRAEAIARANSQRLAEKEQAHGRPAPEPDNARFGDVRRKISAIYLRLMQPQEALNAALAARQFDPLKADTFGQLAEVLGSVGRGDDAAVALMEGVLITTDQNLRNQLLSLYRGGLDRQGCATLPGANGGALNPSCEMVHRHLCAASAETIKLRLETQRRDLAETMRTTALRDFGCPAGPL